MRRWFGVLVLSVAVLVPSVGALSNASDSPVDERVVRVIDAVGGQKNLLNIFRFRERILITSTPAPPVKPDEKGNRTSVVQAGGDWWIGTKKRDKEKVRILCWAWSLRILLDDKSRIEAVPDIVVDKKPAFGLRVTGSVDEPIDLYFDSESHRLRAIDYSNTRHVFSDWKKTEEGYAYPAHVAGFRIARRKGTVQESQWYQTDILELVPLKELPSELK